MKGILYKNITTEDKNKILGIFNSVGVGKINEISTESGFSARHISKILKENGVNIKRRKNYTLNDNFFSNILSEDQAYLLGLIYADGSVEDNRNLISVSSKDKSYLKKVKMIINYDGEIVERVSGFGKTYYIMSFSSEQMSKDLKKFGLCYNKAENLLTLPNISEYLIRHFLRGYFDGDGCIYESTSTTKSGSKKYYYKVFAVEIIGNQEFLERIGDIFSKYKISYTFKNSKCDYMKYIRVKGNINLNKLYELFYDNANTYLQRKKIIFDKMKSTSKKETVVNND
jgi:hypothetical protein